MMILKLIKSLCCRGEDWALVLCHIDDKVVKLSGNFGCSNHELVCGQQFTGTLRSKRGRDGTMSHHFKGKPYHLGMNLFYWAMDNQGFKAASRQKLTGQFKRWSDLERVLTKGEVVKLPGIGKKTFNKILDCWKSVQCRLDPGTPAMFPSLKAIGSTPEKNRAIMKLFVEWADFDVLKVDPWRVVYDTEFEHAQCSTTRSQFLENTSSQQRHAIAIAICTDLGYPTEVSGRIKSIDAMKKYMQQTGSYWCPVPRFYSMTKAKNLDGPYKVMNNHVALCKYAEIEEQLADYLVDIHQNFFPYLIRPLPQDCPLDKTQLKAVSMATTNGISIIYGGAGVGKTTITRTLFEIIPDAVGAAPTGKAAQRMKELAPEGTPIYTVHRMVYSSKKFNSNVLILDEQSMQEPYVLWKLLSKEHFNSIIFVGDRCQLTSVGPGQFLRDCINSTLPSMECQHIYRTGPNSVIALNGQKIRDGDVELRTNESFRRIPYHSSQQILPFVKAEKYTILCSTNSEVAELNKMLKPIYNPDTGQASTSEVYLSANYPTWRFHLNDLVINITNKYIENKKGGTELQVANGEIGKVISTLNKEVTVQFESGASVIYEIIEMMEYLRPAWALTVNKAQGSEYDNVIMIQKNMFWGGPRERLYTGITRAKQKCILFETHGAVKKCIQTPFEQRQTYLTQHIQNRL